MALGPWPLAGPPLGAALSFWSIVEDLDSGEVCLFDPERPGAAFVDDEVQSAHRFVGRSGRRPCVDPPTQRYCLPCNRAQAVVGADRSLDLQTLPNGNREIWVMFHRRILPVVRPLRSRRGLTTF